MSAAAASVPASSACLVRRPLPGVCPDGLELYRRLCSDGRQPDSLLFEAGSPGTTRAARSLVLVQACVRLEGRGQRVRATALEPGGVQRLHRLHARLAATASLVERGVRSLELEFRPAPRGSEEQRLQAPSPLDAVRALLDTDAPGVVAGVFSYDLLGVYESLPPPRAQGVAWPDFEVWLPRLALDIDHEQNTSTILAQPGTPQASIDRLAALCVQDERGAPRGRQRPPGRACLSSGACERGAGAGALADLDDAAFEALVLQLKAHIVAGDVFQIVASRTFTCACPDPMAAFTRLRELNPSAYRFYVHGSSGVLFGTSPESALQVAGTPREVRIRPIAGTRPRGRSPDGQIDAELDASLETELRLDPKERAEHMMLVDLARNDVARVSEPGTRRVERLMEVERSSHVMHLVSEVTGRLRDGLDPLHAYVATMNMGTLVGAPKLKAAELLRRYEVDRRGPYGGAVGYVTADGRMDSAIVIRSAVVREGVAHVRAGAGVVLDSDPHKEADETRRKAAAVLQALAESEAGVREVQP